MIRTVGEVELTPLLSRVRAPSRATTRRARPSPRQAPGPPWGHAEGPLVHQVLSLANKLHARVRERWLQLVDVEVTHRAGFAYVNGVLPDGQQLRLCRLRYGSASRWGFSIYRVSYDDYQPSALPDGLTAGTAEDALRVNAF